MSAPGRRLPLPLPLLRVRPPSEHILYRLPALRPQQVSEAELDDSVIGWAEDHGFVDSPAAKRLSATRVGYLIAHAYPGLRPDRAAALAGWFTWLFLIDDFYDDLAIRGDDDLKRHATLTATMLDALGLDPEETRSSSYDCPLAGQLARVWQGIAPAQSPFWRMRFSTHVTHFLAAFRYEALNRRQRHTPPLAGYTQLRRCSGSVTACLDLLEFATGREVPPLLHETDQLRTMVNKAADVVVWVNDVVSLAKELAVGETTNGVLVVQREFGMGLQEAVDHVYERVGADVRGFLAQEEELLRLCADWVGVTDEERAAVASFATGMKAWMRANLDWSVRSGRYRP